MQTEQILLECIERRKIDPTKTPAQIVSAVMDEINGYKAALRERIEYKTPVDMAAPVEAEPK